MTPGIAAYAAAEESTPYQFRVIFQSPDGSAHDIDGNPVPEDKARNAIRRGIM